MSCVGGRQQPSLGVRGRVRGGQVVEGEKGSRGAWEGHNRLTSLGTCSMLTRSPVYALSPQQLPKELSIGVRDRPSDLYIRVIKTCLKTNVLKSLRNSCESAFFFAASFPFR